MSSKSHGIRTLDASELCAVHGGSGMTVVTLPTLTITPQGTTSDNDDSWTGEDQELPPPNQ